MGYTESKENNSCNNRYFDFLRKCFEAIEDPNDVCIHKIGHYEHLMRKGLELEGKKDEANKYNGTTFDHVVGVPGHNLEPCTRCCGMNNDCQGYKPVGQRKKSEEYKKIMNPIHEKLNKLYELTKN